MSLRPLALAALSMLAAFARAGAARAEEGDVVVTDLAKPGDPSAPGGEYRVTDLDPKTGESITNLHDASVTYLAVGPMLSFVGSQENSTGFGLEGTLMHYRSAEMPALGWGPFVQLQLLDGKWFHADAGVQAAFGPVGIELGLGFRQGDDTYASTVSAHLAEFVSIGYLAISLRESPVIFALPSDAPSFGLETAFTVTLKVPFAIAGHDTTGVVPNLVDRF